MATTAATVMSHNIPPLPSMTSAPRIRPPRIPKGTPNVNTEPQPEGIPPPGKVWVQGKWRQPSSRAVQHRQEIYSRRVEKALKHETLGTNIYAYNHLRTKQVIYSLTRNMENNKVMEQLLFHGKKTVPAALRRDMWTPYFSIHFPPTIHGAETGKLAYHRLRELSMQRQLSPPKDMVTVKMEDIDEIKAKYDPIALKDMLEHRELVLPRIGQRLPQKALAKRLMDQKATSVADVCFVLKLCLKHNNPRGIRRERLVKFKERMDKMGRRAKSRLQKIRQLEARRRDLIRLLAAEALSADRGQGNLTLTGHAAARVSSEYQGYSRASGGFADLAKLETGKESKATEAQLRESMADVQAQIDALLSGTSKSHRGDSKVEVVGGEIVDEATASENTKAPSPGADDASTLEWKSAEQALMVKMMWADQRDSAYAVDKWPQAVIHGSLERWSESRKIVGHKQEWETVVNEEGETVRQPAKRIPVIKASRSIHVIGGEQDSLWAQDPEDIADHRLESEVRYQKGQEAALLVEQKMEEAMQMLQDELAQQRYEEDEKEIERQKKLAEQKDLPESEVVEEVQTARSASTISIDRTLERLEQDQTTEEDQERQLIALEQQWFALDPTDREGISRERAIDLARALTLQQQQAEKGGTSSMHARTSAAKSDAARVGREDGVVIEAPRSGWFDRVKAMLWRR